MNNYRISDEELVRQYLATRKNDYFGQLYKRYSNKVYRRCLTITKSQTSAEDYTQDIFIRVLAGLPNFKERATFSTWLYTVSTNYCMDRMKAENKYTRVELDHEVTRTLADTSEHSVQEERYQLIDHVLKKMNPSETQYLRMKYQENMDIREMAQLLQVKDSAVKMRLKRVRDKVKVIVQRYDSL